MTEKKSYKQAIQQEHIDPNTGELIRQTVITEQIPDYVDVKLPRKHHFSNGGFVTLFQNSLGVILREGNLTKNEMKLLLWLFTTAGIDGSVDVTLDIIAEDLSMAKTNVSTALKKLVQSNIVIRKDHTRYDRCPLQMQLSVSYDQLNYNLAFNGKTKEFINKRGQHPSIEIQKGKEWVNIDTGEPSRIDTAGSPEIQFPD